MITLNDKPAQLAAAYRRLADVPGSWHIAQVKNRNEKALAHDLMALSVDHYLPLRERETYSGNRRRRNLYPLFPSYLFFAGDNDARCRAFTTNRIANVIPVIEAERAAFVKQLTAVEAALAAGEALELSDTLPSAGPLKSLAAPCGAPSAP